MDEPIYIVSGARTPMGGLLGDLATISATQLGSVAIEAALDRVARVLAGSVSPPTSAESVEPIIYY